MNTAYGLAKTSARILFILLFTLVTYLAVTPISHDVSTLCWDKANHLAAFLCLAILADLAFLTGSRVAAKLLLLLLYSCLIEGVQHFVPGRQFAVPDLAANTLGLLLALVLLQAAKGNRLYRSFIRP